MRRILMSRKTQTALLSILLVIVVMLATCGNNPMPETKTHSLYTVATIESPVDWYIWDERGAFVVSPKPGEEEPCPEFRCPMVLVLPASFFAFGDPTTEEILQGVGEYLRATVDAQTESIEVDGMPAFRRSFTSTPEAKFPGQQGWFALTGTGETRLVIFAMSPANAWEDQKEISEAMLFTVRFEQ
jgi:hypothetical protein